MTVSAPLVLGVAAIYVSILHINTRPQLTWDSSCTLRYTIYGSTLSQSSRDRFLLASPAYPLSTMPVKETATSGLGGSFRSMVRVSQASTPEAISVTLRTGDKFRATPNLLLFQTPEAYNAMFGHKANVKKSPFYEVWRRNKHDLNTLGCTNVEVHARRRKALSLAFTEQSVKATVPFVARHVDRWNELMPGETFGGEGWSGPQNLTKWADYLLFDMFGDICFGSSNNTKEPGLNDLKSIPHNITRYLRFYNPVSRRRSSPCLADRRSSPNPHFEACCFGSSPAAWIR